MLVVDGKITMTGSEWAEFEKATFAPWTPRTVREFQAMCDLGAARHLHENTGGQGFMLAIACDAMKFGEDGKANFPSDQRRMAYIKVHGVSPTDEELAEFEGRGTGTGPAPAGLHLVGKDELKPKD